MRATDWDNLLHPDFESVEEMLYDLYITKSMSLRDIALFLGINREPLTRKMKQLGIPIKRKGRPKGNGKPRHDFREARPDGFSENSRGNEKRDCKNYADCLCYCAIQDIYVIPCEDCDGNPKMNHFLMQEYIADFQDHHQEGAVRRGAWHPTDRITKYKFDLNRPSDVRKLIKKHGLSDRPMSASDFRYFRYTNG